MKLTSPPKKLPRPDLKRRVPPGYPLDRDLSLFWLSYAGVVLTAIFVFGTNYSKQYQALWYWGGAKQFLKYGAIMPDFVTLLPGVFTAFLLMPAVLLVLTALHYQYFYLGSKSIYLMRRLPDKWELHRRCLTLPLAGAVIVLLTAVILFLLCFLHYMTSTPPECLTPGQWAKIWSVIP